MTLAAGTRLGPYEIVGKIGAGGMGEVWKAKDTRLGRDVAIKVLPAAFAEDAGLVRRFHQEAKVLASLNHANVVQIFEAGDFEGSPFLVMELLEGETLRARLQGKPLAPKRAMEIAREAALGLSAAHEKGILHRDLKPENLFQTKEGHVKVLDFGLAKFEARKPIGQESETRAYLSEPGTIVGTSGYMSPEQVRGETLDYRSDLFSLGVILWEMLAGKRPFAGDSAIEVMHAILKEDPPELEAALKVPPALERILRSCLAKEPSGRFHSAYDLAFALEGTEATSTWSGTKSIASSFQASRLPLLGALAVGGLLAWAGMSQFHPAPSATNVPVAVRSLTYSGRDTSPAASPDGRTVAFISKRDGQPRIWLKQVQGGGEVALTTGPDDFPRFSPDGSSILFIRDEGAGTSLYRMSVLGTDLHKVVENATHADWSPDGSRIAFLRTTIISGTFLTTLYLIEAGGGTEMELARFNDYVGSLRWNPNGSSLALTSDIGNLAGKVRKIYRVEASDGSIREFQAPAKFGAISSTVWVSTEEVIYFQAESVVGNNISASPSKAYRHHLKTGSVLPLFWAPVSPACADILPGGRVIFDGMSGRHSLREYILAGKSGPPRWLTRGDISDRQPAFSPDGDWIVFSSNRSGNLDLWAISSQTGGVKRITDDAAEDWDPRFSPDGRYLLWSSNRSGAFEIWMANADGSGARQVTQDGFDAENPAMTRDGSWVVYISTNPKNPGLWRIHPDGTDAGVILGGVTMTLPEISPDGQYILYRTQLDSHSRTLNVIRLDDGSKEVFHTTVEKERKAVVNPGRCRWMPDGRHIIFTGQDEKGSYGAFIQDFVPGRDTRASRKPLGGFDPDWITESLGISADRTRLVLAESERIFNLFIAEGVTGLPVQRKGSR